MIAIRPTGLLWAGYIYIFISPSNGNNNKAIYIAQIRGQQQMGCRVISVQTERLSA